MSAEKAVVGVFTYIDDTIKAIEQLKLKDLKFKAYSPTYVPELETAIDEKRSPVSLLTSIGGLTGLVGGFTLAIMCSLDYPLRVSAKDVVAPPSFVVVGYECTILFGAIATLLGIMHFCRLPDVFRKVGYKPEFSRDKFGLVVGCSNDQVDSVKNVLESAGADEVEVAAGL